MSSKKFINIKGAKAHNLNNINLKIPRDKLVVITGLSGSGKSLVNKNLVKFFSFILSLLFLRIQLHYIFYQIHVFLKYI